jgi:hypothetical protein
VKRRDEHHGPLSSGSSPAREGTGLRVFFFFSSRLGCLGSLFVSAVLTLLVLFLLDVI